MVSSSEYKPLRVMGFLDKPKRCGFRFKLTRGDEKLITEISGLLSYIALYNSDNVYLSITTPTYTPVPKTGEDVDGYWSFDLEDSADADKNGYWIDYRCTDGLRTQYPYRYKSADKAKVDDLIPVGAYEDIIPYWKIESSYIDIVVGSLLTCLATPYDPAHMGLGYFVMAPSLSWGKRYNVKSSVPYEINRRAKSVDFSQGYKNLIDHFFFGFSGSPTCCRAGSQCLNSGNTSTGDVGAGVITGGGLSVSVTIDNVFDEEDNIIMAVSIDGADCDITFTNTTPNSISHGCPIYDPPGSCTVQGSVSGSLRSLSGRLSLLSISANYDY